LLKEVKEGDSRFEPLAIRDCKDAFLLYRY